MAINENNVIVEGASGKFGKKLVFRQKGALTVMAKAPKKTTKLPSEGQLRRRELFDEASFYARAVIADEVIKARYQAKVTGNQSAYNVAFKDYLKAPKLSFELDQYHGTIGDIISLKIAPIIEVTNVHLSIYSAEGVLLEEGDPVQQFNTLFWDYVTTVANPEIPGTRIVVSLINFTGNSYEYQSIME